MKACLIAGLMLLSAGAATMSVAQETSHEQTLSEADSVKLKRKEHTPFKATIMSAALPGLGQVYNGKWWKVPIIYGAFGGLIYSSVWNDLKCRTYREAYLLRIDDDPTTIDQFEGRYTDANLKSLKELHQRNRDLSLIFTGVIYALNIVDASVDAHLRGFDVSDDLTLKVRPGVLPTDAGITPTIGLALLLR